jgi:hypothetical protein
MDLASTAAGVPPTKLLPWPATQMGAAIAINAVRSLTRDSGFFSRVTITSQRRSTLSPQNSPSTSNFSACFAFSALSVVSSTVCHRFTVTVTFS